MLKRLLNVAMAWLDQLLNGRKIWSMAVVRRYCDANGAFVGEL